MTLESAQTALIYLLLVYGGGLIAWGVWHLVARIRRQAGSTTRHLMERPEPPPWVQDHWACDRCRTVNPRWADRCQRCRSERASAQIPVPPAGRRAGHHPGRDPGRRGARPAGAKRRRPRRWADRPLAAAGQRRHRGECGAARRGAGAPPGARGRRDRLLRPEEERREAVPGEGPHQRVRSAHPAARRAVPGARHRHSLGALIRARDRTLDAARAWVRAGSGRSGSIRCLADIDRP